MDRVPPHSDDAEKSVLGAIMMDSKVFEEVGQKLQPDDFYNGHHKLIYETMRSLYINDQPVDIVTVSNELKKANCLDKVGGRAYISSLCSDVPSISNVIGYANIVVEKASLRTLISAADGIKESCYNEGEEPKEIIDRAERDILEIAQEKQNKDYSHIDKVLLANMDMISKAIETGGKVTGIPTGYKAYDEITSGLHRSDLIILAARPAMGKTAFALNIALNVATKAAGTVLIFSLEMSEEQLGQRLLSMQSRIPMQQLKTGDLSPTDLSNMSLSFDSLSKSKLYIDDTPGISLMEMKNKCRRLKASQGLDLIVVDYLQLMKADGKSDNRQQEVSTLSRYMKLLAREMDCPIIVLSQLSRAPEARTDHRPMLSDLRESGSIEQDADIVLFLYRDDYYNPDTATPGICEVNLAKHRSGPTGKIELTWVESFLRFADVAKNDFS